MFEEKIGMRESELQQMLTPKSQLAIFHPLKSNTVQLRKIVGWVKQSATQQCIRHPKLL
ncbi:hypothetical protein [Nostoc sp.]|uniref:hypothetical protein n=1 Tax=Nostoc sp. TaxID=1180 RepID=UPI002FFA7668